MNQDLMDEILEKTIHNQQIFAEALLFLVGTKLSEDKNKDPEKQRLLQDLREVYNTPIYGSLEQED